MQPADVAGANVSSGAHRSQGPPTLVEIVTLIEPEPMSASWVDLATVLGLVGVNAVLSGTEMALISLRGSQLESLAERSKRGQHVAELVATPSRYLSALQLGITLAGFLASASAAVELSQSVAPRLGFLGGSAKATSVVLVTIFVSLLTLVFGELVPKRIAMLHAERWSLAAVIPLTWFMTMVGPVLKLLEVLTDSVLRLTGGGVGAQDEEFSNDEFMHLIVNQTSMDPSQRQILFEAVAASDRTLRHILVPRPLVVSVDVTDSAGTAAQRLRETGVSRAPLIDHDLDHPVGHIHILDLVDAKGPVASLARPVLALPESLTAFRALRQLQASQTKLAVVVDEHGGTAGIVTVEDIVEELIGEIHDHTDQPDAIATFDTSGAVVLPGTFPIHRVGELDLALPDGTYVTVAGLVLERLGHLPEVGEHIDVGDHVLTVSGRDRRSITTVTVRNRDATAV